MTRRVAKPPPRQLQILQCIADGLQDKEICRALGVSVNTVKSHTRFLYVALDVNSRSEAVMAGVRLGYLDPHAESKHKHTPLRIAA